MTPVTLMPSYQPETYYQKDGDSYKLAVQSTQDKNAAYYSLADTWASGDIYVPGCYYIKNGSSWETTFTPAHTGTGGEVYQDIAASFDPTKTYYGINYNDIETNYVQVVDPTTGKITYEQQRTYKINRAQAANLINYYGKDDNLVLEASLEDYAYTPLEIATEEDFKKCQAMTDSYNNPVVLYTKDIDNAGQMAVASKYVEGATYYMCH